MTRSRLVLMVAGEASADLHGSNLVRAISERDPRIAFWGIGGKRMEDAGVRILAPSSEMAVVGLTEVFSRLKIIIKAYRQLRSLLKNNRPDLLILIDYPDFNISLARAAKRFKVPVLYYISPQVWAWRRRRTRKLVRRVDRMAVILPFEEDFYSRLGMDVTYVGHPLLDAVPRGLSRTKTITELGLEAASPVLGLLPGSRKEEISHLLPPMIKAAEMLSSRLPRLKCVLPMASTISPDLIESIVGPSSLDIRLLHGDIYKALKVCDMAMVASGTATLETALMEVPMVIVYKVSTVSYWIARMVVRVPCIGLVNLVAGEKIVPELIQGEVTPDRLAHEALRILEGGQEKENMVRKLRGLRDRLGGGSTSEHTAAIALDMIRKG